MIRLLEAGFILFLLGSALLILGLTVWVWRGALGV